MNNNFANNLKKVRKDNNLSQEQLADELGVSRQAISKWESGAAYPEMDKIIALCDKFNLNIDDLLHRDIKEVKGEQETKKNINMYIDDFLKFVSDTFSLFTNMSFGSKVKFLIEQCLVIFVLWAIGAIAYNIIDDVFEGMFNFIPHIEYLGMIMSGCLKLFLIIVGAMVWIHIYKTRYLNYYSKLKEEKETETEEKIEDNDEEEEEPKKNNKKERIDLKKKEDRIVIRDPEHSEYGFVGAIAKVVVWIIKFFAAWAGFVICGILIGTFIAFVLSFLVWKTGAFFFGLIGACIGVGLVNSVFLIIIINFIFNRKGNRKGLLISFLGGVILFGMSCGLITTGALDFDFVQNDPSLMNTITEEFDMKDDLFFNTFDQNYIETDINNIKIEYRTWKNCEYSLNKDSEYGMMLINHGCDNPMPIVREVLKNLNNKKIVGFDDTMLNINVYASKENIEKLKANRKAYWDRINERDAEENRRRTQIYEYENKIEELEGKIEELESQLEEEKEIND